MSKPTVVSICAQKGGTGKTTTAFELAAKTCEKGIKTLLIDFDPQGSLSDICNANNTDAATIYDAIIEQVGTQDTIQDIQLFDRGFDFIAANETLAYATETLEGRFDVLKSCIDDACKRNDYSLVIIDSAPMPQTAMSFNVYAASDYIIMTTLATRQSTKSLTRTFKTISTFARANGGKPQIAGVLVCDFNRHGKSWTTWLETIKQFCDSQNINLLSTPIRHTVKVESAQSHHEPVVCFDAKSTAACDYETFGDEVIDRLNIGKL